MLAGSSVVSALAFVAYRSNKRGVGHTLEPSSLFDNLYEVFAYSFTGAEFGTFLRGTGLFPSNALSAAETLYPRIYPPWLTLWMRPEVCFASIGFIISIVLFALYWAFRKDIRRAPLLWLVGTLTMFSAFVLPGLGRWQFGLKQALSLRYQHFALFGLVLLLIPLVLIMLQGLYDRHKSHPKIVQRLGYLLKWCLVIHFSIQFYLGSSPTHAVRAGIENRAFIDKLVDWRSYLDSAQTGKGLDYSYRGHRTELFNSYPDMPKVLTPGRKPDDIYRTLHSIDEKDYPLETPQRLK
jgi:uncharacterized membrane protein